jgi:hypothetical protein
MAGAAFYAIHTKAITRPDRQLTARIQINSGEEIDKAASDFTVSTELSLSLML